MFSRRSLFKLGAGAATAILSQPVRALDRLAGWQADLEAARGFLDKDRSFAPAQRAAAVRAFDALGRQLAALTDQQVVARIAQIVASAGNAHTRAYTLRNRSFWRRWPVRLWSFDDGWHVVAVKPGFESLLGRRVLRINGEPVDAVAGRVAKLWAGNASWRRYMAAYGLTSPDALAGIGVLAHPARGTITVEGRGRAMAQALSPLPLDPRAYPNEAWWDLSPRHPGLGGPWVKLLADDEALPLYLSRPTESAWFARTADDLVYFQFNRTADPAGEPLERFGNRLLVELRARPPRAIVADLRFNTGGDLFRARGLFAGLASSPRASLFCITGRATFSAALYHVAQLRGRATLVGEAPGDHHDYWAEGGNIVLPNAGLTLHYADRFHSYSPAAVTAEQERYLVEDLTVPSLLPDWPIGLRIADYRAGRDPALEAVRQAL